MMTRGEPISDLSKGTRTKSAFVDYARVVKAEIDVALPAFFEQTAREHESSALVADVAPVIEALRGLVERGGKRLRGVLLAAAYEGSGGKDRAAILPALVSFELLQGYLLSHDDWIDEDDVRRGGPTVHAALRPHFDSARDAEIFAVLAGDFAAALSLGALASCAVPEDRIARATRAMAETQRNVVLGQMLDVAGSVRRQSADMREAIERVYDLKTASYTLTGPLTIGALLAGASEKQAQKLADVARPLGVMFQLKDDLLGVFGDPSVTGKSDSSDLRQGKFTALIVEAASDPRVLEDIERLQKAHAKHEPYADLDGLVDGLRDRIASSGARARIEQRIAELSDEAASAIESSELNVLGKQLLSGAAAAIGGRHK